MKFVSTCLFASLMALAAVRAGAAGDVIRQFDFGAFHRCALTESGSVQCLGESSVFGQIGDGQPGDHARYRPATVIGKGASKVVTGSFFSCAIVSGALQCWGDVSANERAPAKPRTLIAVGVTDAAAGDDRVCAIVGDAAQCVGTGGQSGSNEYQQLHPVPYTEIAHGVRALAVGHLHACAVVADALLCWGDVPFDASDRRGRVTRSALPVRVIEHGVSAVAAGANHDCAIVDSNGVDGALWCWGDNTHGQVGIGIDAVSAASSPDLTQRGTTRPGTKAKAATTPAPRSSTFTDGAQQCSAPIGRVEACWVSRPVRVIGRGVTRVFAKGDETCALVDGALQCWGANAFGQLGIAASGDDVPTPAVAIAQGASDVALSGVRACALVDGALQCTRRCVRADGAACRPDVPGFEANDLAFGVSELEARLGVWRGTIGTQAVSVCLQRGAAGESSYYYARHRRAIALVALGTDGAHWREGDADNASGVWLLHAARGDLLDGTWSAADGSRQLPIALTRVHVDGDDAADCGGSAAAAYNAARVASVKPIESTGADGLRTVSALDGHVSVVELPPDAPHAVEFNAAMRSWLDAQIAEYFGCGDGTPQTGGDADFRQQRDIEWRAGTWLVLRESYELYCGGAHPSGGVSYQTWDLASGTVVDPWEWIRDSKARCDYSADCGRAAPDKLNAILLARASRNKDGDECADAVNENRAYGVRPSRTGLVFTTDFAHVIQACDEDIEVPFAELTPFLTAHGMARLKALLDAASEQPVPAQAASER